MLDSDLRFDSLIHHTLWNVAVNRLMRAKAARNGSMLACYNESRAEESAAPRTIGPREANRSDWPFQARVSLDESLRKPGIDDTRCMHGATRLRG